MGENLHVSRKITKIAIVVCVIMLVAIIPVYAWYVSMNKLTRTEDMQVDMPPIIYIRDDNLEEVTSFHLDGLKIGEEYNEVFCVSPALIGSVKNFFLGVIYTENLGMEINIYPVDAVTDTIPTGDGVLYEEREVTLSGGMGGTCYFQYGKTWPDNSDNSITYGGWTETEKPADANLNYGVYKSYNGMKFTEVQSVPDTVIEKLNDTSRYRFFILNITWPLSDTGEDNAKEADIVYIVTKGNQ